MNLSRPVRTVSLASLSLLAVLSIAYIFARTLSSGGGIDFHSYWLSGLFLRQRIEPYQAYLTHQTLTTPVSFVDRGQLQPDQIIQPELANVPANTAPLLILLSPFASITWLPAKIVWMLINLALILIVPGLFHIWTPEELRLSRTEIILFTLGFIGLFGTRNTAGNGQTGLFVFALMLASLRLNFRSPALSGLALGIAVSKYSLALPLVIFYLIRRRWRILAIAASVQLVAAGMIAVYTRESIAEIFRAYYQIMLVHIDMPGIHLGSLLPSPIAGMVANLIITLTVLVTIYWLETGSPQPAFTGTSISWITDLVELTSLSLWTLLIAYHRAYDSFMIVFMLYLLILLIKHARVWQIAPAVLRKFAPLLLAGGFLISLLPASGMDRIFNQLINLPDGSVFSLQRTLMTLALLTCLGYLALIAHSVRSARIER